MRHLLVALVIVLGCVVLPAPPVAAREIDCGLWESITNPDDQRLAVTVGVERALDTCTGTFVVRNNTPTRGIGGYTLQLRTAIENAIYQYIYYQIGTTNQSDMFILTMLDAEIVVTPIDPQKPSRITILGEMNLTTISIDVVLFLIETAFSLLPPGPECVIPKKEVVLLAVRLASILGVSTRFALEGDFTSATRELRLVLNEFFQRLEDNLIAMGYDCAASLLPKVWQKVAAIGKLVALYLAWIPKIVYHYFRHQGSSVIVQLEYASPPNARLLRQPEYPVLRPAEIREISFELQNSGGRTWDLHTVQLRLVGGSRFKFVPSLLEKSVAPGERITWTVKITAPATPGAYTATWQMSYREQPFGDPVRLIVVVAPEGSGDELRLALEGMLTDARQRLQEQWDATWAELRQRIEERIREEIERELRRLLAPICGTAPAAVILIGSIAWRLRQRRHK